MCIFVKSERLGDVKLGAKKKGQPNNLKLKTKNNYLNTADSREPDPANLLANKFSAVIDKPRNGRHNETATEMLNVNLS